MALGFDIVRTDEQIWDLLNKCSKQADKGGTRYPGMSYEDGIRYAIDWLTDEDRENPMDPEEGEEEEK